jgi:hypothetical protein
MRARVQRQGRQAGGGAPTRPSAGRRTQLPGAPGRRRWSAASRGMCGYFKQLPLGDGPGPLDYLGNHIVPHMRGPSLPIGRANTHLGEPAGDPGEVVILLIGQLNVADLPFHLRRAVDFAKSRKRVALMRLRLALPDVTPALFPASWIQIISFASLTVRRLVRALPLWCDFWKRIQNVGMKTFPPSCLRHWCALGHAGDDQSQLEGRHPCGQFYAPPCWRQRRSGWQRGGGARAHHRINIHPFRRRHLGPLDSRPDSTPSGSARSH